jgi:hypothetical protein
MSAGGTPREPWVLTATVEINFYAKQPLAKVIVRGERKEVLVETWIARDVADGIKSIIRGIYRFQRGLRSE